MEESTSIENNARLTDGIVDESNDDVCERSLQGLDISLPQVT